MTRLGLAPRVRCDEHRPVDSTAATRGGNEPQQQSIQWHSSGQGVSRKGARVVERNWSTSEAANRGGLISLTAARHWPVNTLSFEVITRAVQYGSTCPPICRAMFAHRVQ
jgi:hypothetical protein